MKKKKTPKYKRNNPEWDNTYTSYVEHPRFGKGPRLTGLDVETDLMTGKVYLHWNSSAKDRIPGTAIAANVSLQQPATLHVTHYYDVKRVCRRCNSPFIFFGEEQKHWYEELGFPLEVDCLYCQPCRREQRGIAKKRARYEELFHVQDRTSSEMLEMAECCLSLIEERIFNKRQKQQVHKLLKMAESGENKLLDSLHVRLSMLDDVQDKL